MSERQNDIGTAGVEVLALRMALEIMGDIQAGILPNNVASFVELHDFVDANDYAQALSVQHEEMYGWDAAIEARNAAMDWVDQYLKNRTQA